MRSKQHKRSQSQVVKTMNVLSVNIAQPEPIRINGRTETTGIYKRPAEGPVAITTLGLAGDSICSTKHHGGPDQAVYVYTAPDYAWWQEKLGRGLDAGTFGENLTISDLASASLVIGDRLRIGDAELEVTSPRIPCMTLESRMGLPGFAGAFRNAERPGFYCRVLKEGLVQAGDAVSLVSAASPDDTGWSIITNLEVFRDYYEPELTETAIRRFLEVPIAIRTRKHKEKQLAALLAVSP